MSSAATAYDILESMSLDERIAEVAKDVLSRTDRYKDILPEHLAVLLDIDFPDNGFSHWEYVRYAPHVSAESLLEDCWYGMEDILYQLGKTVGPERIEELKKAAEGLDSKSVLSLLSADERRALERGHQEDILASDDDAYSTVAYCEARSAYSKLLMFEATIGDAGKWEDLRTPYDRRDGKFTDLTGCLIRD